MRRINSTSFKQNPIQLSTHESPNDFNSDNYSKRQKSLSTSFHNIMNGKVYKRKKINMDIF